MNWQQQQQQQQQQAYNQMYFQQYGYPGALPAAAPRGQAMGMYPGMMMPPAMGYAPVTVTQQQPTAAPRVQEQQVVVAEGSSQLANVPMNVFVGKLPLSIDDSFVAHLLKQCGPVLKWKRATEAETDKPKAFGFCTFASAHGAMQAVRVLNDLPVMGDQKILVKVGKKEQAIIDSLRRGPQLSASELALLETLRRLVASHDPRAPVREGESLQPAPTSAEIDPAIVEEMAKFRSKQAQRDRELEEERRRKLQARIHEAKDEEAAKLLAQRPAKKAKPAEQPVLSHEEPTHMAQTTAKLGFGLSKHAAAKKTPLPQKPALFAPDEAKTPRPLKRLDDDDDDDDNSSYTLFFGCRHPGHDHLYKDEPWHRDRAVLAFSRHPDPALRAYVTHRLKERAAQVAAALLGDSGAILVAGNLRMATDVRHLVLAIIRDHLRCPPKTAAALLEKQGRFAVEAYG